MSQKLKFACVEMFRETFEGVKPGKHYTWYVEGKEAILPSLKAIDSEQASREISGARATIGAHANHLCYYLHLFNTARQGAPEKSDWEGSWKVQAFDEKAWEDVRMRTQREYESAYEWFQAFAETDADFEHEDHAISAVANITHAAFHLGAIRALIPIVQ